jgi:outer membrane lipopolysaccharide assembly protein LptE/RlpB
MVVRVLMVLLMLAITACGWQLRGVHRGQFPEALQLVASNRYAPLVLALQQAMQGRQIAALDGAALRLEVDAETLSKRTVAVTSIGSAAQYELSLSASWRLYSQQGQTPQLLREGIARTGRVFDFQAGNNLGKFEEENTLMADMRQELAASILAQTQNTGAPNGQN